MPLEPTVSEWNAVAEIHANTVVKEEISVRREGPAVRLRGQLESESGHELAKGAKLFVVPALAMPPHIVIIDTTVVEGAAHTHCIEVKTNGEVLLTGEVLASTKILLLDGTTWHWY